MTRRCIHPGCPAPPVSGGRCRAHGNHRSQDRRVYNSKRWRILRRRVLFEQPLCDCGALAEEVDHIRPLADGGAPYDRANLKGRCKPCHSRKTRAERR